MKATFFQKPLEFSLFVEGESWQQGDSISGTLTVKNHGATELDCSDIRVALANAAISKVRKKDPAAFSVLKDALMGDQKVTPGAQGNFSWKFETDRNSTVTEKSSSLYLLYGKGTAPEAQASLGQIQLTVRPYMIVEEFLNSLKTQFHFVLKSQKTVKGWLECKLDPPSSRNYSSIEQLTLSFRFEGDELLVHYLFDIKKLEATPASTTVTQQKREFEQNYSSSQYSRGGRFNFDVIEAGIQSVISQLGLGALW